MNSDFLYVCLVAPLPPPLGGISKWTTLVRKYALRRSNLKLKVVDTAVSWRAVDDLKIWKRAIGGGLQSLRNYIDFLNVLRTRPDIVHLTTSGQLGILRDLAILATARLKHIPAVYHLRFGRVSQIAAMNTWEWRILVFCIRMASIVMVIDSSTETTIKLRIAHTRVVRIPNGVDLKDSPNMTGKVGKKMVLFLGWVIPSKGIGELVQAWAQVKPDGWHCIVAGPGSESYRGELYKQFKPAQLEFLPEQPHDSAMRLIAESDVFVLPSYTEGFPNVIVEAMVLGKTVIGTNVGAIPEMLSDGCGVVISPRNVEALSKALHTVCSDARLRKKMGTRAKLKACAEYDMAIVFNRLNAVWQEAAF